MRRKKGNYLWRSQLHLLVLVLFCPSILTLLSTHDFVTVTVDRTFPTGVSQFSPGMSHVDNTFDYPWRDNNLAAVNHATSLLAGGIRYQNTSIMGWGVLDPWPDPSQADPTNWGSLDRRLQLVIHTGGIPVLTLCEAPWWMKGELQSDGTTRLLSQSEEWSDIAYSSRILDNKMGAWLHLVERVAERYMASPYNVRYFQVWNEMKGYYNPSTNAYDYTTSPGDPSGPNATHGYTYMYNLVYAKLMQVAASLGIPASSVNVGGPYPVMDTWSSREQSNPSNITTAYGTYDKRALDVVRYWLEHKAGAGFITVDGNNRNKDDINIADPFTAAEKYADIVRWIRSLNNTIYPGAATLPIWLAEWNATPYSNTASLSYVDALRAYAMIRFLKAGGAVALMWGGSGSGIPKSGLWTPTTLGGGQALPWYFSYKALKDNFAPGTLIYKASVSAPDRIEALASATAIMLVNKTPDPVRVHVGSMRVTLRPYQVTVLSEDADYSPLPIKVAVLGLIAGFLLTTSPVWFGLRQRRNGSRLNVTTIEE